MTNHPYLEEIGTHHYPDNYWGGVNSFKDYLQFRSYKREQRRCGVNPTDCWNLDTTFYQWLYEHLKQFLKDAEKVVDLENTEDGYTYEYEGEQRTLKYMTLLLIDKTKTILTLDDFEGLPEYNLEYQTVHNADGTYSQVCVSPKEVQEEWTRQVKEANDKYTAKEEALRHEIFTIFEMILPALWW